MRIQKLELLNFRNYHQLALTFEKQIIIFLGNNAQGKTNLLESIFMSAMGKSHRANQDSDLIRWNESVGIIRLEYESRQMAHQIEISITLTEKRIKKDGKIISKRSELVGQLPIVLFTPDDLSLVKGEPSLRRRFLDLEISQTHPVYLHALQRYYRALKQRNTSIRDVLARRAGLDLVHAWDAQLVEFGSQIILERRQTITRLNESLARIYPQITGNSDSLELIYQSAFSNVDTEIRVMFLQKLLESQKEEIARGITLTGPQRDDIRILLNGHDLKSFGSQGEQRTVVLALKLAEIEFITQELGEPPIVALDDFMSELDDSHITFLLNSLTPDIQTFITAIHPLPPEFQTQNIRYYQIEKGLITPH